MELIAELVVVAAARERAADIVVGNDTNVDAAVDCGAVDCDSSDTILSNPEVDTSAGI